MIAGESPTQQTTNVEESFLWCEEELVEVSSPVQRHTHLSRVLQKQRSRESRLVTKIDDSQFLENAAMFAIAT